MYNLVPARSNSQTIKKELIYIKIYSELFWQNIKQTLKK